jgi:hypothetical protein
MSPNKNVMRLLNLIICSILLIPLTGIGQNHLKLSGIVIDSLSGKALENINIFVEDQFTGTISNYDGDYLLYLKKGNYRVQFSAPGYNKTQIAINLNDDQIQMVELSPKMIILKNKKKNKNFFDRRNRLDQNLLSENR